jgi:FkbH-like protein
MPLAPLQAEKLCRAAWRFGELGRAPWAAGLAFLPDGRIGSYQNPNETSWRIVDGRLEIFSAGGELTWRFIVARETGGLLELEGSFLLDDSFKGVGSLREIAAPAVAVEAAPRTKLAVLVVGYGAPKILDRMAAFFDGLPVRLFAHIDAKKDLAKYTNGMRNAGKITFIEDRVPVFWGGFSIVAAELALLRAALADPEIANVVLVSDDTAPLLPAAEICRALAEAPDRIASAGNGWREGWYRGFFYPDCTYGSLRGDVMHELRQFTPADFAMITRLETLRARGKKPIKSVQFCRQWWALSREKLETVMKFVEADEHYVESFRFSLFADETFFPTAFKLCFPDETPLAVPTYADFATVPRHPNPWIYQSAAEISKAKLPEGSLFIRKLAPERPEIIDDLTKSWLPKETELEAVRLVIWNLDETFWRGTLAEGGISYVQDHHDIVVALARRGIVSSICSKNDLAPVKQLLAEKGLWEYFVFPSINWEAIGPRVVALLEAMKLRAPTVLLIDQNESNRGEVLQFLPGIQIGDQTVISALLANPLLKGTEDSGLTRLEQYRLLEARQEAPAARGGHAAFLHASDIRVTIDHDVEARLDRAVELINRTNQLNFTKQRLPEDLPAARAALRALLNQPAIKAGLVHVQDRYGDYGYTGLYVISTVQNEARYVHYCFSCRVQGMAVETWLHNRLGRPNLTVVGEVLTDLLAEHPPIEWINANDKESGPQEIGSEGADLIHAPEME